MSVIDRLRVLDVPLERDVFLRTLLRHLSGTLEEVIGLSEASGFIAIVGQRMGEEMNHGYRAALGVARLPRESIGAVLVDLKRRIQGDFFIIEETDTRIVLGNRACPFGDRVVNRPSLCMMTSNVFGAIAASNVDYAKVILEKTIARGDSQCRIVVHLQPTPEAQSAQGREYVGG